MALLLTASLLSFLLWKNNPLITEENQLLELAQAALLLLACFMHGERAFRLQITSLDFLLHAGLALLTYSFALRELDIDQFGTSQAWPLVEKILRLAGVVLWAGLLIFLIPKVRQVVARRSALLALPCMVFTIGGGLFFMASWPFDKQFFSFLAHDYSVLIEEILELIACILLFTASLTDASIQDTREHA